MSMLVTPFISLNGNAADAIQFYERTLSAQVVFCQTYGEAPKDSEQEEGAAEADHHIAHSVLKVGDAELFVSDTLSESSSRLESNDQRVQVCLTVPDIATSHQIYEALKQDGLIHTPLQQTYFSPAYGVVTDRFGVTFQIFTRRPQA